MAIVSSRQKIQREREKKIWELDSNNRNGDRDSSHESNIDESLDSLNPIEMLSMHSFIAMLYFICFLCPAAQFVFWHLCPFSSSPFHQISFKKNQATALGALSALQNTKVFGDSHINFTRR